jgi:hypothetical protein
MHEQSAYGRVGDMFRRQCTEVCFFLALGRAIKGPV